MEKITSKKFRQGLVYACRAFIMVPVLLFFMMLGWLDAHIEGEAELWIVYLHGALFVAAACLSAFLTGILEES